MIQVTRLDNSKIMVNVEKIQSLQASPDTIITFTNDVRMIVREPVEELSEKIRDYQRTIHSNILIDLNYNDTPQALN
ncbi:MAG: flagellar FlbD family protein [Deltaproteobacteria bacterium]|nr:flagellar FlbD family protein [Deltaproteobacteria bacterium]